MPIFRFTRQFGAPSARLAHYDGLTGEQRSGARDLLGSLDIRRSLTSETAQRLEALGIAPTPTNRALAMRLVLEARAQATRELREGVETVATAALALAPVQSMVLAPPIAMVSPTVGVEATSVLEAWRTITPVEAAELMIAANLAMLEHRTEGKRAGTQVGEQTLRQIRWAAHLLQKSMNPDGPGQWIRPIWTCTFADIVTLDSWFDRLPVTCGKSPLDRKPTTSLKVICDRALDRIDAGELEADAIGLDGVTILPWLTDTDDRLCGARRCVTANLALLDNVRRLQARYGSPRMHAALRAEGHGCSRGRVERLMRRHRIRALAGRRFRPCTTDSRHYLAIAPNLLAQRFGALPEPDLPCRHHLHRHR